ncbi:hypothetical protein PR048_027313 [Dryococelus australis]|uniref:Uncharacterized protein n=1 Tax=Dryococelus australis TaxID=614101 RepID=A0ABQ9GF44_9NEOP|nr:hypothetical protein PR048_027313 [Dryococelus australis]
MLSECVAADHIKVCHRNDLQVDKCINASIDALRNKLKVGIPEWNVPPIEPLTLDQVVLRRGPSSALLEAVVRNAKAWGGSDFLITSLRSDLDKNEFRAEVFLPKIRFEGDYQLRMTFLLFNIQGKGFMTGSFSKEPRIIISNYTCDLFMKGHKVEKDGQQFLEFERMRFKLRVGDARFNLSDLFGGDPVLGPATNTLINENSALILEEVTPALEKSLEDIFTRIANSITLKFPYQELFP